MSEDRYNEMLSATRRSVEYWAETAIMDFTEEVVRLMDEARVSRADLARIMGTSQAYITKLLGGNANFTITTMTRLARAFDRVVRIHLAPDRMIVHWEEERIPEWSDVADTVDAAEHHDERIPAYYVVNPEQHPNEVAA